jgi:hypothetical protein
LQQYVRVGPREPVSPDCLDIHAILRLLDRPETAPAKTQVHLAQCRACQRAVLLAREERELLEAAWADENADASDALEDLDAECDAQMADVRNIVLYRWLRSLPVRAGIAAVLLLAIGLAWWVTRDQSVLGPVVGEFMPSPDLRDGEAPIRQYRVTVELKSRAYVTFLYLDHTGTLSPLAEPPEQTSTSAAKKYEFWVDVTKDPPGPQWIAALAAEEPFDALALREQLQGVIDDRSATRFSDKVNALEEALRRRAHLSFRGHQFNVPERDTP